VDIRRRRRTSACGSVRRHTQHTADAKSSLAITEWVIYGQKWKTVTGRQYFTDIIGLSSTIMTLLASSAGKKMQNKSYYATQGHRGWYQSKACMWLPRLVINSNWHPISYHFGVIAAHCSNLGHFAFWATLWRLTDNVRCSSWAHWKARIVFLLVLIELFLLGFTAEALLAKIDRKSAISLQRSQFDPKFQVASSQFSHRETL